MLERITIPNELVCWIYDTQIRWGVASSTPLSVIFDIFLNDYQHLNSRYKFNELQVRVGEWDTLKKH